MSKSSNEKGGLSLSDLVSISAGQVIGAGVVTLIGSAISVTGVSAWIAYGGAVLVGLCSILPFIFLSSAVVLKGGEYGMWGEKMGGVYAVAFTTQCLRKEPDAADFGPGNRRADCKRDW